VRYLVDSDWAEDYLAGKSAAVQLLDPLAEEGLAISIATYGEVYEGILFGGIKPSTKLCSDCSCAASMY